MNILIIGGGGREHAVAWALGRSPRAGKLWFAPGNGGTAELGENTGISATDLAGVLAFCKMNQPDLVAVLPDDPLALGMVDLLERHGIPAFGPTAAAARIESSKSHAKAFMARHGIPTAGAVTAEGRDAALAHAQICALPIVVKADGLALGKGVIICHTRDEVVAAVDALCKSASGSTLLFEDFLEGPEVTQLCFASGADIVLMPASQDHKRAFDGDLGPNTGGMGAFSPVSVYDAAMASRCMEEIYRPTVHGLVADGTPFKGVLYFSLMLTADGPKVIEYNARFGDPEAQTVLPLLESDLLDILLATREGTLASQDIRWRNAASCCVVLASGGYPGSYAKGLPISGLDSEAPEDVYVFHAGTAQDAEGSFTTAGGRVLAVTAIADTLAEAVRRAYAHADILAFEGAFCRRDIAAKDAAY